MFVLFFLHDLTLHVLLYGNTLYANINASCLPACLAIYKLASERRL